jgi:hypothetical protein
MLLLVLSACKKLDPTPPVPATGTVTVNVPWGICNDLNSGSLTTGSYEIYVDRVTNNDPLNPVLESFKVFSGAIRNNEFQKNISIEVPLSGSYAITIEVTGACNTCINNCPGVPRGKPFFRKIQTKINQGSNAGGFVYIITLDRLPAKCNC